MANRLLDRQVSLLEYLTSGTAIFGSGRAAPLDQALHGIDGRLLNLEARLSHEKRMEKIVAIFPTTFEILGNAQAAIVREFVDACPPVDISHIGNARQFYEFLSVRWRREPVGPPYLCDVMACEFACARTLVEAEDRDLQEELCKENAPRDGIRRARGVILLRCAYDIRPIFEEGLRGATPAERDTPLAIAILEDTDHPRVVEMLPIVFDLLATLDDWTDPTALGLDATPELSALIHDLVERGLLEVRK